MLYMVVEKFKDPPAIYKRLAEKGRMMPEGLNYISSWIDTGFDKCFQLMEAEDIALFDQWIANWDDLMEFEVVPVFTSKEAAEKIKEDHDRSNQT